VVTLRAARGVTKPHADIPQEAHTGYRGCHWRDIGEKRNATARRSIAVAAWWHPLLDTLLFTVPSRIFVPTQFLLDEFVQWWREKKAA